MAQSVYRKIKGLDLLLSTKRFTTKVVPSLERAAVHIVSCNKVEVIHQRRHLVRKNHLGNFLS